MGARKRPREGARRGVEEEEKKDSSVEEEDEEEEEGEEEEDSGNAERESSNYGDNSDTDDSPKKSSLGHENESGGGAGGLGGAFARILARPVDAPDEPVLALRKTQAMREAEAAASRKSKAADRKAERRTKLSQQLVAPSSSSIEEERKLRKIATRGVVALFNAIAKAQRSLGGEEDELISSAKAVSSKSTISKEDFMDMLDSEVKQEEPAKRAVARGGSAATQFRSKKEDFQANKPSRDGPSQWSVLRDDYMMGELEMKDWDKSSDED